MLHAVARDDGILNVQHREERGDDCAVLCRFRATGKSTIRARGEGERPNAPPALNSGGRGRKSLFNTVQYSSGFRGERTRQSREDGGTISINRPENQHERAAKETETRNGFAHCKWLMPGRIFQLVMQLDGHTMSFTTIVA